jgi:hypothetical protein
MSAEPASGAAQTESADPTPSQEELESELPAPGPSTDAEEPVSTSGDLLENTSPMAVPDVESEPSFESIDLFAATRSETPDAGGVDPQLPDDANAEASSNDHADRPGEDEPRHTTVQGIVCSRGHFNRPQGRFCSRCGISMVHQTHNLVSGPRPPLGVLVVDDGAVFALTTDFVIGREPEVSEDVAAGTASALFLEDSGLTMSRVHAKVILDGWEVRVVDSGSANGTYALMPSETEWTRLEKGVPTTIEPGTCLSFGGRTMMFESHQRD